MSKIIIYESELNLIAQQAALYPDVETGGDLFGLWTLTGNPVIQYVLGAGPQAQRHETAFYQDRAFLEEHGTAINTQHALQHVGEWHSHHRMMMRMPSMGDIQTVRHALQTYDLKRFALCICNLDEAVINDGFLFPRKASSETPYLNCAWVVLPGISPLRPVIDKMLNLRSPKRSHNIPWHVEPLTTLNAPPPEKPDLPPETWLTTDTGKACFQALYEVVRVMCGDVRLFQQDDHDIVMLCRDGDRYLELTFPPNFPAEHYRVALAVEIDENGRLVEPAAVLPDEVDDPVFFAQIDQTVAQYYPVAEAQEEDKQ